MPVPLESLSIEKLAAYAARSLNRCDLALKRQARDHWRAGDALRIVRAKLKGSKVAKPWVRWLKDHGLPYTTVKHAIRIREFFAEEASVRDRPITEVKREAGILGPKSPSKRRVPAFLPIDSPPALVRAGQLVHEVRELFERLRESRDLRLYQVDAMRTELMRLTKDAKSLSDHVVAEIAEGRIPSVLYRGHSCGSMTLGD